MIRTILKLLLAGGAALVCSLAVTPLVARILVRLGVVDRPSARRINTAPIPRGGGIAVIFSFFVAMVFARVVLGIPRVAAVRPESDWLVAGAAAALAFIGLLDDVFGLKPVVKLVGQLAVALMVYSAGISFGQIVFFPMPEWLNCLVTLGWFALIINAFNLVDGLDGLAAGLAVIGSAGLAACLLIRGNAPATLPLFALMGACLGFLRYNFNPASVFLGDTGSMFLGFVLATVPLVTGGKAAFLASVGVPLLVIGVPLFDTVLAIVRRSMRAQMSTGGLREIFLPDMEHLHHRFLSTGLSQRRVALILYVLAAVMVAMAVGVTITSHRSSGIILLGSIVVFGILSRQLSRVELWYTGNAIRLSLQSKARRLLLPLYVVCDIAIAVLGWWLAADLALIPHIRLRGLFFGTVFPVFLASIFAMLWAFQIYHRLWARAQARDYAMLLLAICFGWLVGYSFVSISLQRYPGFWRHALIFLLMIIPPMLMARVVRVMISSFLQISESTRHRNDGKTLRFLVYGAGERFLMFEMMLQGTLLGKGRYSVAGVVDDDPFKMNRFIHGYRVGRGFDDLEPLAAKSGATAFLVAADIGDAKMAGLLAIARRRGMPVFVFRHVLDEVPVPPQTESPVPTERKKRPCPKPT